MLTASTDDVNIEMGPSTKESTAATNVFKPPTMLSSSQLSDLFGRLDSNGDGELDLNEFLAVVNKLKLKPGITEDDASLIFKKVDKESSGTLSMQEFISAYQLLYSQCLNYGKSKSLFSGLSFRGTKKAASGQICRCVRYGRNEAGQYIFETYVVVLDGATLGEKEPNTIIFKGLRSRADNKKEDETKTFEEFEKDAIKEIRPLSLEIINQMIFDDARTNHASKIDEATGEPKCQLLWWIDAALSRVSNSNVTNFATAFGLNTDPEFLNKFSGFGSALPKNRSSRIHLGTGTAGHKVGGKEGTHGVSSKSIFLQTTFLKNRPIVHPLPTWLEFDFFFSNSIGAAIAEYYRTRFAWFFNLSSYSGTRSEEKAASYKGSYDLAVRLRGSAPENIKKSFSYGMPAPPVNFKHKASANWVLSKEEMSSHPPMLGFSTLGIHMINHGFGTNCVLTIREIDDEKHPDAQNIEQKSALGQFGRIMSGIYRKLFDVTKQAGGGTEMAELDDSSGALVAFITLMCNSLSMNTMGSVESWLDTIEEEVDEIMAVSKHNDHIAEIEFILKAFRDYVHPLNEVFTELSTAADAAINGKLVAAANNESSTSSASHVHSMIEPESIWVNVDGKKWSEEKNVAAKRAALGFFYIIPPTSNSIINERKPIDFGGELFGVTKPFWGNNVNHVARELKFLLDGNTQLEVKGLTYWQGRLDSFGDRVAIIHENIQTRFAEKRDFISYTFTIVSILMAPAAILTGYFGMNFDNMVELDSTTYPSAPGVVLLWICSGVIYVTFILVCFHYRIFYSST